MTVGRIPLQIVTGDEALAEFREGLTGPAALEYLAAAGGRLLSTLPVGVGKTEWMVKTVAHALATGTHDLVIVLVPRRDILQELLDRLPRGLDAVVLRPRPRKQCGVLDAEWVRHEQTGCGLLARATLCSGCPRRRRCFWPDQYGDRLRGQRLVLATQHRLTLDPHFVARLAGKTGGDNPLVLLDESNLLVRPAGRVLAAVDLDRFIDAQEEARLPGQFATTWLERTRLLAAAATDDLRQGRWRFLPVDANWATAIQRAGRDRFGPDFRFPAFEMLNFAASDVASRERLPGGDIRFAILNDLGRQFVVYSGSMSPTLARYRIDPDFARPTLLSPFADIRFEHPQTRWFNLNSLDGTAKYFPGNAQRLLEFFAGLITRNVTAGKTTLVVSRKRFVPLCKRILEDLLADLPGGPVQVVTGDWDRHDLADPRVVSLITYGVSGLNRFEHVEAAYCLNAYYVAADAVAVAVHDIEATPERYPVTVKLAGNPPRRTARVELPDGRVTVMPRVADEALIQLEADVVVQAVGRVRPFTRPREIITMHAGPLPGVRYAREFRNLAETRASYNLPTTSQRTRSERDANIRRLKADGYNRQQIGEAMGVSVETVKRALRRGQISS